MCIRDRVGASPGMLPADPDAQPTRMAAIGHGGGHNEGRAGVRLDPMGAPAQRLPRVGGLAVFPLRARRTAT